MDLKQGLQALKTNRTFKCILSTLRSIGIFLNGAPVKGFQIEYLSKVSHPTLCYVSISIPKSRPFLGPRGQRHRAQALTASPSLPHGYGKLWRYNGSLLGNRSRYSGFKNRLCWSGAQHKLSGKWVQSFLGSIKAYRHAWLPAATETKVGWLSCRLCWANHYSRNSSSPCG